MLKAAVNSVKQVLSSTASKKKEPIGELACHHPRTYFKNYTLREIYTLLFPICLKGLERQFHMLCKISNRTQGQ